MGAKSVVKIMETVERFSNRVKNYVKYRPHYPKEILRVFRDEMNLTENSVIADIGSGTGISAKVFLENGNKVFGVEPNALMREAAEEYLNEFENFVSVDAAAENTTLDENSVDFVVAAQAFHWFDNDDSRREFKRIMKDGGFVALMWNERQLDTNEFLREYEKLLVEFGTDYEKVRHDNINEENLAGFFQTEFCRFSTENVQTLDFDGLKGRLLSSSYMPSEENPRYDELVLNLERLFEKYAEQGKIQILYHTNIFYSQI